MDSNAVHVHHYAQLVVNHPVILRVVPIVHIHVLHLVFIRVVNSAADVAIYAIRVYQCVLEYVLLNANQHVLVAQVNVAGGAI